MWATVGKRSIDFCGVKCSRDCTEERVERLLNVFARICRCLKESVEKETCQGENLTSVQTGRNGKGKNREWDEVETARIWQSRLTNIRSLLPMPVPPWVSPLDSWNPTGSILAIRMNFWEMLKIFCKTIRVWERGWLITLLAQTTTQRSRAPNLADSCAHMSSSSNCSLEPTSNVRIACKEKEHCQLRGGACS